MNTDLQKVINGFDFYDYENRIVKIEKPDGAGTATVAEFAYDAQGRRIRVYDEILAEETRFYYSDNWQVLLETGYDSGTSTETDFRTFVYGNYIDEVLMMNDGNEWEEADAYAHGLGVYEDISPKIFKEFLEGLWDDYSQTEGYSDLCKGFTFDDFYEEVKDRDQPIDPYL